MTEWGAAAPSDAIVLTGLSWVDAACRRTTKSPATARGETGAKGPPAG
ncbi:hypothetical protein BwSG20_53170 [Bradyrhizobium ottawaense]|nr:hypothetical protein BwSG20_53170 [Bradyrhizobium ottawaense]